MDFLKNGRGAFLAGLFTLLGISSFIPVTDLFVAPQNILNPLDVSATATSVTTGVCISALFFLAGYLLHRQSS